MNLQEKYDELDNIVITIEMLINETNDKYFVDMLKEIKFEAQDQRYEIQGVLWKEEEKELEFQNKEFEKNRL